LLLVFFKLILILAPTATALERESYNTAHCFKGATIPVMTRLVTASNAAQTGAAMPEAKLQICWLSSSLNQLMLKPVLY
jgi:hypothetical protein